MCSAAGDKVSLAIGMTGLATELLYAGRSREGSRLASEQMALLESIGDPTLTMGLAFVAFGNWFEPVNSARSCGGRRPSSTWPTVTPPRAPASVSDHRWRSRWHFAALLGGGWAVPGGGRTSTTPSRWPENSDPATLAAVVAWTYGLAMQYGVLRADDSAVRASEEAVQTAEGASNDHALGLAEYTLGVALLNRDAAADRHRGLELMVQVRDMWRASVLPSWSRSPSCWPPGRGPGAATAMLPLR